MSARRPFTLIYAPVVKQHLRAIDARDYSLIRSTIEAQLSFDPDVETRNRKPLKRPAAFEATWEIRFGPNNRFRVFYDIDRERRLISVLAIGIKQGNRLMLGGEEVQL